MINLEARSQQNEKNASQNDRFTISCMHLVLRREYKEDYMKFGESKAGTG